MYDDLATLESQRSELMEEFLRLGDLRPRFHHCRDPTSRQAFLPLRQARRSGTRSTISSHPPRVRQDGDGNLSQSDRAPQGAARLRVPVAPPVRNADMRTV
jgi:hypothetical protein